MNIHISKVDYRFCVKQGDGNAEKGLRRVLKEAREFDKLLKDGLKGFNESVNSKSLDEAMKDKLHEIRTDKVFEEYGQPAGLRADPEPDASLPVMIFIGIMSLVAFLLWMCLR